MKIGLVSDTHGFLHERIPDFFRGCEEIWHCGDIGNMDIIYELQKISRVIAVSGNIDYGEVVKTFPVTQTFTIDGLKICMTHIGGYPGHYSLQARKLLETENPGLFVCGHSHILKVMFDKKYNMLCINPGAAGKTGFHVYITAIRFLIVHGKPQKLEVFEAKNQTVP